MNAPFFSTFTFITEIVITAIVLYIFYSGYKKNVFPSKLALFAISYEVLFNISYMAYRAVVHVAKEPSAHPPFRIALLAFHGTLALVMFLALIAFLLLAWRNYRKGVNYFLAHKKVTIAFLIFWFAAVFSGILFYVDAYIF